MEWSPTRSAAWRACRLAYWLKYIAHAAPSQWVDGARMHGRLVHAGIAQAYEAACELAASPGDTMAAYAPYAVEAVTSHSDDSGLLTDRRRAVAIGEIDALLAILPAPAPSEILGVERPFTFQARGVTFRVIVDLLLRTGPHAVHIRDWKTGVLPDSITLNPQLGTYNAAVGALLTWVHTITVGLYNTRRHEELAGSFTQETTNHILGRLLEHHRAATQVASAVESGDLSAVDAYPPTAGSSCSSCVFRSYCPLFARADLPVRDAEQVARTRLQIEQLRDTP